MVYAATLARTGLGNIATYCRLQTALFAPLIKPVFRHTWECPPVYKHDALLSIENSTQQDPRRHRSSVRASARRNVISKALRLFAVMNLLLLSLLSCAAVAEGADAIQPAVSITLNPSLQSPQMLGTSILWTASVQNAPPGHTYDYQFSVTLPPQNQIVRDFAFASSFTWVPYIVEGNYTVNVVVRDVTQQPYIVYPPVSVPYTINPWVTNSGGSAVNATKHPLIALFSAGPCTAGHSIRVRFHQNGSQVMSATNAIPCSQSSANFYVAGMTPSTQYQMHWEEFAHGFLNSGPDLSFTTGSLPPGFPILQTSVNVPPSGHDAAFPLVLWQFIPPIGTPFVFWPTATDLAGNVLWYYPGEVLMTHMEAGGNWFTLTNPVLKEFDLAGNETLETNTRILNEQLTAKGYPVMDSFNA